MTAHSTDDVASSSVQQERVTIAFLIVSWLFILLRIWTRTFVISSFGWDDSAMILAGMVFTVYCAATLYVAGNGGGTHVTDIVQLQALTKWVVVSEACYIMAMMIIKISLAIFFARIVVRQWHLILIYATLSICMLSSTSAFFYSIFRCGTDLDEYAIQQLINDCAPRHLDLFIAYQQAAFSTVTDIVFVAMPILVLWNANMDRRTKVSVGAILCMATLGTVCSIIRFRYIEGLLEIDDFFWNVINITMWSTIEAGACIVAGCIATLRPLLKCAMVRAQESTALSGYRAQISRTLRSSQRSHVRSTRDIGLSEIDPNYYSPNKGPSPQLKQPPTYVEYIARPGSAVVPLSSDIGDKRASTDFILERPEPKYKKDMS